jgi:TetR/AcrR family transcriptional regulator, mexJK operon transcriptional repressor
MDEIAAQARVSKRTIYNVFGGKEQLFREVLADALATAERFSRDMASALGTTDDGKQNSGISGPSWPARW